MAIISSLQKKKKSSNKINLVYSIGHVITFRSKNSDDNMLQGGSDTINVAHKYNWPIKAVSNYKYLRVSKYIIVWKH